MDDEVFCLFVIFASVIALFVPEPGQVVIALFAAGLVAAHLLGGRSTVPTPERGQDGVRGR